MDLRIRRPILIVAALLTGAAILDARVGAADSIADRRVLLVSAPSARDPRLDAQRREARHWGAAARDRDLVVIQIVGERVIGSRDTAAMLRRRYQLSRTGFAAALIGKDGHVAYRESEPITGKTLFAMIDGMPMRRAGQR